MTHLRSVTNNQNGWHWSIVEGTDGITYASWKKENWPNNCIISDIFDSWDEALETMQMLGGPLESYIHMFFSLPVEFEVRVGEEIELYYNPLSPNS